MSVRSVGTSGRLMNSLPLTNSYSESSLSSHRVGPKSRTNWLCIRFAFGYESGALKLTICIVSSRDGIDMIRGMRPLRDPCDASWTFGCEMVKMKLLIALNQRTWAVTVTLSTVEFCAILRRIPSTLSLASPIVKLKRANLLEFEE